MQDKEEKMILTRDELLDMLTCINRIERDGVLYKNADVKFIKDRIQAAVGPLEEKKHGT